MDAGFIALFRRSLDPASPLYKEQFNSVYLFSLTGRVATTVYSTFFLFTGTAIVGSLYFNKAAFIKTALLFCAICLVVYGLNWLFADLLFGQIDGAFPFRNVDLLVGKSIGSVELPQHAYKMVSYALAYCVPGLLWIVAYIRLREKEF